MTITRGYWLVTGWQYPDNDPDAEPRLVQTRCYSEADARAVGEAILRSAALADKAESAYSEIHPVRPMTPRDEKLREWRKGHSKRIKQLNEKR